MSFYLTHHGASNNEVNSRTAKYVTLTLSGVRGELRQLTEPSTRLVTFYISPFLYRLS